MSKRKPKEPSKPFDPEEAQIATLVVEHGQFRMVHNDGSHTTLPIEDLPWMLQNHFDGGYRVRRTEFPGEYIIFDWGTPRLAKPPGPTII